MIEFEIKAPAMKGLAFAIGRLASEGARAGNEEEQVDSYYAHPARDYAATDEALRVRARSSAKATRPVLEVTYKGPKLDLRTKARRELTLEVATGDPFAIVEALGFREVARVEKRRAYFHLGAFEVALDDVARLGAFIEIEAALAEGAPREALERDAFALLLRLGGGPTERRSYLELLLASGRGHDPGRLPQP